MRPPCLSPQPPRLYPVEELLTRWPVNQSNPPPPEQNNTCATGEALCTFDYENLEHRLIAASFRDAQLPFLVRNIDNLEHARLQWTWDYLGSRFDDTKLRVELSDSPLFLYWNDAKVLDWKRGTYGSGSTIAYTTPTNVQMHTFHEWGGRVGVLSYAETEEAEEERKWHNWYLLFNSRQTHQQQPQHGPW